MFPRGLVKFGEGPGPSANPGITGSLPAVDPAWTYYKPDVDPPEVLYTPEQMRELIRDMQDLPIDFNVLYNLTMAMNAVAALGQPGVDSIMADVIAYHDLVNKLESLEGGGSLDGINLSPDGLPMIRADVIEWSDKALGCCDKGGSYFQKVLAPFKEARARLVMKLCQALNLCAYDLKAVCCTGAHYMDSYFKTARLYRS